MEYQLGLDECFCYKCYRLIREGEYKLRVRLSIEEVIAGETEGRVLSMTYVPSLCASCAQGVLRETEVNVNVFVFPRIDKPTLFDN